MTNSLKILIGVACLFVSLTCGKFQNQSDAKEASRITMEIKHVAPFYYVAIEHSHSNDFQMVLKQFQQEIETQQIIPTGPIFLIFYKNPTGEENFGRIWAIGCPTAEGAMVKEPLVYRKWTYQQVATTRYRGSIRSVKKTYTQIQNYVTQSNWINDAPIMNRVLDGLSSSLFSDNLRMEVWIPISPELTANEQYR